MSAAGLLSFDGIYLRAEQNDAKSARRHAACFAENQPEDHTFILQPSEKLFGMETSGLAPLLVREFLHLFSMNEKGRLAIIQKLANRAVQPRIRFAVCETHEPEPEPMRGKS